MSDFGQVGEFHRKFGLRHFFHGPNKDPDRGMLEFRHKFLQEELDEFTEGVEQGDHAKMFDALLDLVYVAHGTAHLLGYPWPAGWAEVQRANMAKERASSADDPRSKRGHELDVVKPEGWTPPDIEAVLRLHGF